MIISTGSLGCIGVMDRRIHRGTHSREREIERERERERDGKRGREKGGGGIQISSV